MHGHVRYMHYMYSGLQCYPYGQSGNTKTSWQAMAAVGDRRHHIELWPQWRPRAGKTNDDRQESPLSQGEIIGGNAWGTRVQANHGKPVSSSLSPQIGKDTRTPFTQPSHAQECIIKPELCLPSSCPHIHQAKCPNEEQYYTSKYIAAPFNSICECFLPSLIHPRWRQQGNHHLWLLISPHSKRH